MEPLTQSRGSDPLIVLRDVGLITVLGYGGGFIGEFAARFESDPVRSAFIVAISGAAIVTIGFTICGCLTPRHRWAHLLKVMIGAWVVGFIINLAQGMNGTILFMRVFYFAFYMGLGGAVSLLIRRPPRLQGEKDERGQV